MKHGIPGQLFVFVTLIIISIGMPAQADTFPGTLIKELDTLRKEYEVPALAFTLVSSDDILWTGALGLRDLQTKQAATADTLFRIGSITKAFTGLAMLKLQEEGKLSLSDPLAKYFSDAPLTNPWKKTNPVRIAHLLEHTSGLLDLNRAEFDHSDPTPWSLKQGLYFGDKPRTLHWPPGLHSSYSNTGPGYAAYVLEKITGQQYEDFITENFFQPLEMNNAGFFLNAETKRNLATGYDTDGKTTIPYWHMILRPFGGINATPREMGHFVQMLLNRGKYKGRNVMQEASIMRMEIPTTTLAAKAGLSYGYGLGNYQYLHQGFLFHGHGGDGDGYLSHYAYNRETGLGYFVVINAFKQDALWAIRSKIEDYLIAGHTATEPKTVMPPTSLLEKLTGTYQAVTYRFPWMNADKLHLDQIEIVLIGDKLYTQLASDKHKQLIPVRSNLFRRKEEPVATIAFIEHDGELYLQWSAGNYQRLKTSDILNK